MGSSGETAKLHRKKCKNSPFNLNLVAYLWYIFYAPMIKGLLRYDYPYHIISYPLPDIVILKEIYYTCRLSKSGLSSSSTFQVFVIYLS